MNTLSQKVRRYTTFIRDILELAQPKNIPTGIKLHNILDENSVNDVMDSINDINETIYHNDPSKFLTWAKGFISQLKFHPKTHIVTMKIRIQIPLAYWQDLMPTYMVYQIGFIPAFGGPCSRLNLPNILARKNGTFHEVQCPSDDCRDGHITTMSPSCLKNGSNISCPLILSHCKQLSSFVMDDGILLTTYHKIFTVDLAGLRIKLTHNGSVFISWHGLSRIEVEGDLPDKYHKTCLIYKKYIIHKWSFNYRNINSILLTFNIIKGGKWGLYRILVDFCADGATICSTNNSGIMIGVKLLMVEPNLPQPHFNPFSHVEKGFFCDFLEIGSS